MQDAPSQHLPRHSSGPSAHLPVKIAWIALEPDVQAAALTHTSDECTLVALSIDSLDATNSDETTIPVDLDSIITSSPAIREQIEAYYASPAGSTGGPAPLITQLTAPDQVTPFIFGRIGACVRRLSRANADLLRSTASLRADYEATAASFAALEVLVQHNRLAERRAATPVGPSRFSHPADSLSVKTFEQLLPDQSAGLCDVAIYLRSLPKSEGDLHIQLRALESDEVVGRWTVARRALSEGWLRLALDRALPVESCSLHLSGRWTGDEGLHLGLGVSHPIERWQAAINGERIGSTLAFNRWTASPGLRLAHSSEAVRLLGSGMERSTLALQADMTIIDSRNDPSMTFFHETEKSIQVHPVGLSPTKACLPLACPAGVVRISARVETMHPEAGRVVYGLGLGSPATRGEITLPSLNLEHQSDWVVLPARTPSMVTLFLAEPLAEPADLYLLTRLPEGERARFCWAHFSDITFDYAKGDADAA
ncbi:DUF6212 domain-containing protein [Rhizobium sp. NFR03]|uniref:DUF6212 domain-containing protein n=1 Tax=Rhizobium sp. NFR03 TaxID=1566263 RepID=UPI0008BE0B3B|nr:DUF6212 domain-containing protein [Rhizobium sp. NFR03]SES27509.1 hypothetical protein SAMN03159406_03167 [Rhizobium sp. NFR03]